MATFLQRRSFRWFPKSVVVSTQEPQTINLDSISNQTLSNTTSYDLSAFTSPLNTGHWISENPLSSAFHFSTDLLNSLINCLHDISIKFDFDILPSSILSSSVTTYHFFVFDDFLISLTSQTFIDESYYFDHLLTEPGNYLSHSAPDLLLTFTGQTFELTSSNSTVDIDIILVTEAYLLSTQAESVPFTSVVNYSISVCQDLILSELIHLISFVDRTVQSENLFNLTASVNKPAPDLELLYSSLSVEINLDFNAAQANSYLTTLINYNTASYYESFLNSTVRTITTALSVDFYPDYAACICLNHPLLIGNENQIELFPFLYVYDLSPAILIPKYEYDFSDIEHLHHLQNLKLDVVNYANHIYNFVDLSPPSFGLSLFSSSTDSGITAILDFHYEFQFAVQYASLQAETFVDSNYFNTINADNCLLDSVTLSGTTNLVLIHGSADCISNLYTHTINVSFQVTQLNCSVYDEVIDHGSFVSFNLDDISSSGYALYDISLVTLSGNVDFYLVSVKSTTSVVSQPDFVDLLISVSPTDYNLTYPFNELGSLIHANPSDYLWVIYNSASPVLTGSTSLLSYSISFPVFDVQYNSGVTELQSDSTVPAEVVFVSTHTSSDYSISYYSNVCPLTYFVHSLDSSTTFQHVPDSVGYLKSCPFVYISLSLSRSVDQYLHVSADFSGVYKFSWISLSEKFDASSEITILSSSVNNELWCHIDLFISNYFESIVSDAVYTSSSNQVVNVDLENIELDNSSSTPGLQILVHSPSLHSSVLLSTLYSILNQEIYPVHTSTTSERLNTDAVYQIDPVLQNLNSFNFDVSLILNNLLLFIHSSAVPTDKTSFLLLSDTLFNSNTVSFDIHRFISPDILSNYTDTLFLSSSSVFDIPPFESRYLLSELPRNYSFIRSLESNSLNVSTVFPLLSLPFFVDQIYINSLWSVLPNRYLIEYRPNWCENYGFVQLTTNLTFYNSLINYRFDCFNIQTDLLLAPEHLSEYCLSLTDTNVNFIHAISNVNYNIQASNPAFYSTRILDVESAELLHLHLTEQPKSIYENLLGVVEQANLCNLDKYGFSFSFVVSTNDRIIPLNLSPGETIFPLSAIAVRVLVDAHKVETEYFGYEFLIRLNLGTTLYIKELNIA